MSQAVIGTLEQQRRDALVAYYLGKLVGQGSTPPRIATENDLYEYLLIDNQISAQVDTSRVAQGIASVQQHIHAIYHGMEPGYSKGFGDERLQRWREGMSEYSVWTGYQMIEDYPENYIDPTLRLGKTSLFQALEVDLGQSRISEDNVQVALKNYLDSFELVSNLHVVACYVDGEDFKKADYYFFGRQNVEPFAHYWRKAKIDIQENSTQISPSAWSEWKSIDVAFDAKVSHVRPVVVDGRLHIVWVELGQAEVNDSGAKTGKFFYRAKMAYKKISDRWSPATTIYEGLTDKQDLADTAAGRFTLVASMDVRFAGDPRLIVCFQFRSAQKEQVVAAESERFLLVFDKVFNKLTLPASEQAQLYGIAATMLGADPTRVQYPLAGRYSDDTNQWVLDSVSWNTDDGADNDRPVEGINQALDLEVKLYTSGADCSLSVQGVCTAERLQRSSFQFRVRNVTRHQGNQYNFHVEGSLDGFVLRSMMWADSGPLTDTGTLKYKGSAICNLEPEDFEYVGGTNYSSRLPLTGISVDELAALSQEDIQAGAGFTMDMFGTALSFASTDDYYFEEFAPITHGFDIWAFAPSVSCELTLNGAARTPIESIEWAGEEAVKILHFGALPKGSGLGYNEFSIVRIRKPLPVPVVVNTPEGGQFLDFAALKLPSLRYVRLNTTFAKELVKRAEVSSKSVLSWEAQHTLEPAVPNAESPSEVPLDFKGANGRYFWELFFHLPHLVAHRLHAEFDYSGAENWLHYLFNPLQRIAPLYPPPVAEHSYWVSRPLSFAYDPGYEWGGPGDPDAIAYGVPSHYRKAIFVFYLNNLIAHGDTLYRQLTRDTLGHAQLLYIRAVSLLGPLSKGRSISRWTPMSLKAASADDSLFADFEALGFRGGEHDVPSHIEGAAWLRLLDAPWFRVPVNVQLLDLWDRLALRLYNLRHNLSLDGKTMSLSLYEPSANPFDLLRAQAAGGGSGRRRLASLAIIPAYRFRAMLPRVQNAVETLIRYGEQVRGYMETRDRAHQEELQQSHLLELAAFTETLQLQLKKQADAAKTALTGSKVAIEARKDYYLKLVEQDVSSAEKSGMGKQLETKSWNNGVAGVTTTAHILDSFPSIFGVANGGAHFGAASLAISAGLQMKVNDLAIDADRMLIKEQYRRRRDDWQFLKMQADHELAAVELQIKTQDIAIEAAKTSYEQGTKAQQQAQDYYAFLKSRDAGMALYQWLLSQMSTLYFQAYDAVLSLCLATEACWQYEIGDRDTRFISTNAWADNRFGLTAGESLKLGLLQMESAFLSRHERRLELTKTISLKSLLKDYDPGADSQGAEPLVTGWQAVIAQLHDKGEITFDLKSSLFDKDYPGHYLRQLIRVSVSIPAVIGPYEDTRVILTQQTSSTLLKPDLPGVRHLYKEAGELPPDLEDENIAPTHIVFNPRAQQQIGISTGVDDHGMFMLDFGDERYFPFEGTGAVSRWSLRFARHASERQSAILDSLTDIILHVRYLAVDGGEVFTREVEELVVTVEAGEETRRRSLASMSAQKLLN